MTTAEKPRTRPKPWKPSEAEVAAIVKSIDDTVAAGRGRAEAIAMVATGTGGTPGQVAAAYYRARRKETNGTGAEPSPSGNPERGELFPAGDFDNPKLRLDYVDGKKVDKISIRFSGTVDLDRANPDHVALYRKLSLGKDVNFADMPPLSGIVTNKPNRQVRDANGYVSDVAQTAVITITDVGGFAITREDE